MAPQPRLAIGSLQPLAENRAVIWGLLTLLEQAGWQVQHFYSQASFCPYDGAKAATGLPSRHLDSWLMTPELCREVFLHSGSRCDLRVVEGSFSPPAAGAADAAGGRMDTICEWLQLPRLAIVDVTQCHGCGLPPRPVEADALILDGVRDGVDLCYWQTMLEPLWGKPVLGALDSAPALRAEVSALPLGSPPSAELCHSLAQRLSPLLSVERVHAFASREALPVAEPRLFRPGAGLSRVRVAVAYDDAFHCYFCDMLDLLELRGAEVVEFSPLADETLPPETDIVYLGCGHPGRFARELAANHCMLSALRSHVCQGRRIYAEGGGLAYLCQRLETPAGRLQTMVGLLPAIARLAPSFQPVQPVEVRLSRHTWLGEAGDALRGYFNPNWQIDPVDQICSCIRQPEEPCALVSRMQAIGSRIHFNFALQPHAFDQFLQG